MVLRDHPAYAASHHLTALVAAPALSAPASSLVATPQAGNTALASPTSTAPGGNTSSASAVPTAPSAPAPTPVTTETLAVSVGSTLDATIQPGGLVGPNVAYTIAPQPLPANMTFNRGTGALVFAPAPGQVGSLSFTVTASDGTRTAIDQVSITVSAAPQSSTEVSGQVVDESGKPLANVPVSLGAAEMFTNAAGGFTLAGVPETNPGPLTIDGLDDPVAEHMMLMAPLDQFLGHPAYAGVANVVSQPIVLPAIDVAHATDFSTLDTSRPISLTNPALPGVALGLPAGSAMGAGSAPFTGKLSLTSIPTSAIQKILPPGIVAGVLEIDAKGLMLDQPVQITLPNSGGAAPGAKLNLYTMNMLTGSSDLVGHFVVSADGQSMTSDTGVMLVPLP
jgi:hypothetical protein